MTQKKRYLGLFSVLLILMLAMMLAACGAKASEEPAAEEEVPEQEEVVEEPVVEVVKAIDEVDNTEDVHVLPLQIESITLFEDGTLRIVPTDDLLKNAETNNELVDGAIYPFEDSGKVKDVFIVRFGNGGYRTIICLMDDGSLSAMSANELINDHITVIWDNLTGRDTYVSVEERPSEDGDSYGVVGITEDGEEIDLDFSLDF
jgi:predicted small lipoprotein YifL